MTDKQPNNQPDHAWIDPRFQLPPARDFTDKEPDGQAFDHLIHRVGSELVSVGCRATIKSGRIAWVGHDQDGFPFQVKDADIQAYKPVALPADERVISQQTLDSKATAQNESKMFEAIRANYVAP